MAGRISLHIPTLSLGIIHSQLQDSISSSSLLPSNGHLDPWSGGGVLQSISSSLVAVVIHDGAHHLDLRAANSEDPPDVLAARKLEMDYIKNWITAYRN